MWKTRWGGSLVIPELGDLKQRARGPSERTCLRKQGRMGLKRNKNWGVFWPPHPCVHMCIAHLGTCATPHTKISTYFNHMFLQSGPSSGEASFCNPNWQGKRVQISASCQHSTLFLAAEVGTEYGNKHTYKILCLRIFITLIIIVSLCVQLVGVGTLFPLCGLGNWFQVIKLGGRDVYPGPRWYFL